MILLCLITLMSLAFYYGTMWFVLQLERLGDNGRSEDKHRTDE